MKLRDVGNTPRIEYVAIEDVHAYVDRLAAGRENGAAELLAFAHALADDVGKLTAALDSAMAANDEAYRRMSNMAHAVTVGMQEVSAKIIDTASRALKM